MLEKRHGDASNFLDCQGESDAKTRSDVTSHFWRDTPTVFESNDDVNILTTRSHAGQSKFMPTFVHITSEDLAKKAVRGGLRMDRASTRRLNGIFAMPVVPNFQIAHQWVREIKQWRRGFTVGIYFRISDSEMVWVGRYNEEHHQMTAAQAAAYVMAQTTMTGVEVIVPRRIAAREILRVRRLPQVVGWRHYPGAHGKRPWACPCCQRGAYASRIIREKYAEAEA